MKYLSIVLFGLMLCSCNDKQRKSIDADSVINKSIEVSGVDKLNSSICSFDFRDMHYIAVRNKKTFKLKRRFRDSTNVIRDILSNTGFERYANDSLIKVSDSMASKYGASLNSVHYFAVLPYGLDGEAVIKSYLNEIEIKGKNYYKIKVTFNKDGGGEDFEDVFIYWVNSKSSKIDYLAYSYNEEDGKGLRFREAYNERYVNGVRFVDYNNYKPEENTFELEDLDQLFIENRLKLLSKIELENISVN